MQPVSKVLAYVIDSESIDIVNMTVTDTQLKEDKLLIHKKLEESRTQITDNMLFAHTTEYTPSNSRQSVSQDPLVVLSSTPLLDDLDTPNDGNLQASLSFFNNKVLATEKKKANRSQSILLVWTKGYIAKDESLPDHYVATSSGLSSSPQREKSVKKGATKKCDNLILDVTFNPGKMNGTPYAKQINEAGGTHHEKCSIPFEDLPLDRDALFEQIRTLQQRDMAKNGSDLFSEKLVLSMKSLVVGLLQACLLRKKRSWSIQSRSKFILVPKPL
jgi:hypothetical protein